VQHEEIRDYSPKTHTYRYHFEGGPLPLKTNHGSFAVVPNGSGSLVIWEAEIEAADPAAEAGIVDVLQPAYQQTLERLRQRVEENMSRRADAFPDTDARTVYQSIMDALSEQPDVHIGKMFGAVGLKTGDKVFAMLVRDRLVVKLPKARVHALIEAGDAIPFDPGHGRVLKEWVSLELRSRDEWLRLAEEAREFVAGMVR
jgi:TfoX/Sxy family transcriptional regulator of competence genes